MDPLLHPCNEYYNNYSYCFSYGQTTDITSIGGTLTNSGNFAIGSGTTVGITGDVVNNYFLTTGYYVGGGSNTLNISGTLTNNDTFYVYGSGDVANVKLTLQFYSHAVSQDRMAAAGEMLIAILSHAADQSGLKAD